MGGSSAKTLFEPRLSDNVLPDKLITIEIAGKLFDFFRDCPVFKWSDPQNDCEDRANAICMLLDHWQLPNYKGWVFNGPSLKKGLGSLRNCWKFHVAALVPVSTDGKMDFYMIDPAVTKELKTLTEWADSVTETPYSYHLIKNGDYYIFPDRKITADNWNKRDHQNFKWTIQGLSGINGLSHTGKAYLCFNRKKVQRTQQQFNELKEARPLFLTKKI